MIEVRDLTKRFGAVTPVDRLTFTAPAGKVTAVLGPNGAGKTTTFRCLLGVANPTSGAAIVDGRPCDDLPSPRAGVGAVLESTGHHPARSARDHLRIVSRAAGLGAARVDHVLDLVGLAGSAQRRVGGYSLGMRQRLGLATALLGDPKVLVLDEPSNGLDPQGVAWMRRLLRSWADEGRTVVVSSHVLAEVAQVIDRVVVRRQGVLVEDADVADLLARRVTVRVDDTDRMAVALSAQQGDHERLDDGSLVIAGWDAAEVGALAAHAGVTVTHLTTGAAGQVLEERFLQLVEDAGR